MSHNSFGSLFRFTTFGESHGPAIGCVVDGCPPRIPLTEADIQRDLDRRRPGQSEVTTARSETDQVEVLSGLFEGRTTGTPIALLIRNHDANPGAYDHLREVFRPGHADLTYFLKFGRRDHRGGGRASGRETVARVAAGAVARAVLAGFGVEVWGATVQVGTIRTTSYERGEIERNPLRAPDAAAAAAMLALIQECQASDDSVGGVVEVFAQGAPAGLGDPVFHKLDADLAAAFMSIGGVKGVEIGAGFASASMRGTEFSDPIQRGPDGRPCTVHNRAGGILGGISTGETIMARLAVKPTSSIAREQETITTAGETTTIQVRGRHDPCLCPRIVPVAEAMMCLVLCDHLLAQRAQTGVAGPVGKI
jgi:chorismate synthase